MPLILRIIPFILVIVFGILFLIPCIILWICMCSPKCCCRKKSRITKPFNCLIILLSMTGVSIIFLSIVIVYLNSSEKGINGTLCTLTMLTQDIVQGVGLLKKTEFVKPYWYGLNKINTLVAATTTMIAGLKGKCTNFLDGMYQQWGNKPDGYHPVGDEIIANYTDILTKFPEKVGDIYLDVLSTDATKTITVDHNPTNEGPPTATFTPTPVTITPLYITSLGPPTDSSTDLGKILKDFQNNYFTIVQNIILNMTIQCKAITATGASDDFDKNLESVSGITDSLEPAMENISGDIIDKIDKYKGLLINYLFKSFLAFNIITIIFLSYEAGFMIFYSYRNYNLLRMNLICVWAFIGFLLIVLTVFTAIFGIIATLISDMGDIVDFIFSNENLSSDSPRIINSDNLGDINICLRGDGDLLSVFLDSSTREFTNAIDILFNMYYPITKANELINENEPNNLNSLESLSTLEQYYESVEEDFTLATSSNVHGNLDVSKQITELNKYTVSNGGYQKSCTTYDYYVSIQSKCPTNGANNCKLIPTIGTYSSSCTITATGVPTGYTNLQTVANNFKDCFNDFIGSETASPPNGNKGIIKNLQDKITNEGATGSLKKIYKDDISKLNNTLNELKTVISHVYNAYAEYVNVEALKNGTYVSVFSWINCSVFGKDINATLNIMKKQLRGDLRIIFFISLTNDCIIIGIMVVVTFLLNWYKFDPLENNPVGEMEIGEKKKEYDGDEIYSDGLSSSNNNSEKIHDDTDNDYGTDDIEFRKKSEMQKLNDEQSNNSQLGDNINNPNKINIENKKSNLNDSSDSGGSIKYNTIQDLTKNGNKKDDVNKNK